VRRPVSDAKELTLAHNGSMKPNLKVEPLDAHDGAMRLRVCQVSRTGLAATGGVQVGDEVLEVGGWAIDELAGSSTGTLAEIALAAMVPAARVGATVKLVVRRKRGPNHPFEYEPPTVGTALVTVIFEQPGR